MPPALCRHPLVPRHSWAFLMVWAPRSPFPGDGNVPRLGREVGQADIRVRKPPPDGVHGVMPAWVCDLQREEARIALSRTEVWICVAAVCDLALRAPDRRREWREILTVMLLLPHSTPHYIPAVGRRKLLQRSSRDGTSGRARRAQR